MTKMYEDDFDPLAELEQLRMLLHRQQESLLALAEYVQNLNTTVTEQGLLLRQLTEQNQQFYNALPALLDLKNRVKSQRQ